MNHSHVQLAERLVSDFAARTGLDGDAEGARRRYLWTDAFAVFAMSALYGLTGRQRYADWIEQLIGMVHQVLGRHRPDDDRSGWISGLSEPEGEQHPTVGGLRIGKPLAERRPGEPFDEQLEWERDGQYFHYLTKWMLALDRAASVTGDRRYVDWAVDLAQAAHRAFVYEVPGSGTKRMYWKMSVDLTRPVVPSMGQHDPLDGLATFGRLRASVRWRATDLDGLIADMRGMCEGVDCWATTDALGIGGLLTEAAGVMEMVASGHSDLAGLLGRILADGKRSLAAYVADRSLALPSESRLAFRELGLALGLRAIDPMRTVVRQRRELFDSLPGAAFLLAQLESLSRFSPVAEQIEQAWLTPAAQRTRGWAAHLDINSMMLATSLVPDAYLSSSNPERYSDSAHGARGSFKGAAR